jgi:hypothetical protein
MKKLIFLFSFMIVMTTLFSFTSESNSPPPLPDCINYNQSQCNLYVTLIYPPYAYVSGVHLKNLSSNVEVWIPNSDPNSKSITLHLPFDKEYQVSLGWPISCGCPNWAYLTTFISRPARCNMGDVELCIPCLDENNG